MQILSTLLLVSALAVGFADATPTRTVQHVARGGGKSGGSKTSCNSGEFFWETRSCCLPEGGPEEIPKPPSGVDCPFLWYFDHGQGCCVPKKPSVPATPTCEKSGWSWIDALQCCSKGTTPSHTSTPSPKPKPKSKKDDDDKGWYDKKDFDKRGFEKKTYEKKSHDKVKRNFEQWDMSFCPTGLSTCPVVSNGVFTGDSECIDTTSELTSCGGCVSLGQGQDCSTIPGASCMGGVCAVFDA